MIARVLNVSHTLIPGTTLPPSLLTMLRLLIMPHLLVTPLIFPIVQPLPASLLLVPDDKDAETECSQPL